MLHVIQNDLNLQIEYKYIANSLSFAHIHCTLKVYSHTTKREFLSLYYTESNMGTSLHHPAHFAYGHKFVLSDAHDKNREFASILHLGHWHDWESQSALKFTRRPKVPTLNQTWQSK